MNEATESDDAAIKRPPRTSIDTRVATPDDAATVHAMVLEIAAHEDSLASVRSTTEEWVQMLRRPDVLVLPAVDGAQVLGYASSVRRLALCSGADVLALDDLYVREAARHRGVGKELMSAIARFADPDSLTVLWGARLENEDGLRFYRRLGATLQTKVAASWSPESSRSTIV
jgi:GNAT superfamily N-acetyltransferase